eukprot:2187485-Amphidinium_carterae.1
MAMTDAWSVVRDRFNAKDIFGEREAEFLAVAGRKWLKQQSCSFSPLFLGAFLEDLPETDHNGQWAQWTECSVQPFESRLNP